jgi:WD40 repeat protein
VRLWDPATGNAVAILRGHTGWVRTVCSVVVDGRTLLASGGDRTVRLWDPATGKAVAVLEAHTGTVNSVCSVVVDGRSLLASGSDDATVRLWDVITGRSGALIQVRHEAITIAPLDGALAIGLTGGILVVDLPRSSGR